MAHPHRCHTAQQIRPHAFGHVFGEREPRRRIHIVAQIARAEPEVVAEHERAWNMRTRVQNCIWEWKRKSETHNPN